MTIFLARVLGLYLVVMGLAMFANRQMIKSALMMVANSPAMVFLSAVFTLILGCFLVAAHNIWVTNSALLVTILCWLVFIKGILRVLYPRIDQRWLVMIENKTTYYLLSLVSLIWGIFLCYFGFVAVY